MNPGTVLGLSIATCVFLSALAVLGKPALVLGVALVGLAWALCLNAAYAGKLGIQGRTERRIKGDTAVARQLSLSYLTPVLVAIVVLAGALDSSTAAGPLTAAELQALVATIGIMLAVFVASSHVDWYYIRPRVDGVITEPPCRTSRETKWKGVTRKWYVHRAVASLTAMAAVVIIALVVTLVLYREWENGLAALGGFTAIMAGGRWLMKHELATAEPTSIAIRTPPYWLGDDLHYETDKWVRRGFVLHVAVPVTKLVPLDHDTGRPIPDEGPQEIPSTELHAAHLRPRRFGLCCQADDGCCRINRECTFALPRMEVGRRRRLIL